MSEVGCKHGHVGACTACFREGQLSWLRERVTELTEENARLRREVEEHQLGKEQMRLLANLPLPPHIVTELQDVAYLDDAACRYGTRLDIPAKIPGFDPGDGSDHLHFVLMPIGARSRRAAVEYLKKEGKDG